MEKVAFVLLFVSSFGQLYGQDEMDIVKIEFSTLTRGSYQHIVISKSNIEKTIKTHQDVDEKKVTLSISNSQWERLTQALSHVTLSEVPELESPTRARAYDGARHSSITITDHYGKTFLHTFDNENPNEKLLPLMKAIDALVVF